MRLYHGSTTEIRCPDLEHSKSRIDFGRGFYLTQDPKMACKWAAGKRENSVMNVYDLQTHGLRVKRFGLTPEWLLYISSNRGYSSAKYHEDGLDVIIGPTADDRLYDTLTDFWKGSISQEQTLRYLDVAGFAEQIALKSERAIRALTFVKSKTLMPEEKVYWKETSANDRREALRRMQEFKEQELGGNMRPDAGYDIYLKGEWMDDLER